jgi:DNA end-binding protein Ku
MAGQLIRDMTTKWKPKDYADKFTDAIHALVARKVKAGKTKSIEPFEEAPEGGSTSNVVDLMALLKRSLGTRQGGVRGNQRKAARTAVKNPARKRA